jgi:small subunit ribosomal protein S18
MSPEEIDQLRKYISKDGRILPRRLTKLSAKNHRKAAKGIKMARILGLFAFTCKKR